MTLPGALMTTHIALLRGINVGGKNKVAMAALRELAAGLGFTNVTTLLQSGNLVFESRGKSAARWKPFWKRRRPRAWESPPTI